MAIFIGFMVIVAVVTAIGHLQWKLFAWMLGFRVQTYGRSSTKSSAVPPMQIAPAEPDAVRTTALQLLALQRKGLIDPTTYMRVMAALRAMPAEGGAQGEVVGTLPPEIAVGAAVIVPPPAIAAHGPPPLPVIPLPAGEIPFAAPTYQPAPPPLPVIAAPRPPRRSLAQILASFMESRNIRWGELIGGLLIVGCSIALVMSFWAEIAHRPVFKFSIFTAMTAALFGLGLYSEHRWRLPTTSRGILLIATLLVPLNCLAIAAFSPAGAPSTFALVAQIIAMGLFTWLLWLSSKVIAPRWPVFMTAGTAVLSAGVLVLRGITPPQPSAISLFELGLIPTIGYLLSCGAMLRLARTRKRILLPVADAIFLFLGVMTFATTIAMGLLVWQSTSSRSAVSGHDLAWAIRRLAPLISVGGLPAVAAGLLLWRRAIGKAMGKIRTAGTAVAVVGALVMVAGIVLAWPDPAAIVPVALCDFVALAAIAFVYEIPAAHFLAMPCLWIAWVVGFHVFARHVGWTATSQSLADTLRKPGGGTALAPLVLLTAGASWLLSRLKRPGDATVLSRLAIALAAISVAVLNFRGFAVVGDPESATWIYAAYAGIVFALGWRGNRRSVSGFAWALLGGSIAQFIVSHHVGPRPWPEAFLVWASTMAIVRLLLPRFGEKADFLHARVTLQGALLQSELGAFVAITELSYSGAAITAVMIVWSAAVWLTLGIVEESAGIFVTGQVALCVATVIAVIAPLARRAWFFHANLPLLEPWTIQAIAAALAGLCLIAAAIRQRLKTPSAARLLKPTYAFYGGLSGVLLAILIGLAVYGSIRGIVIELGADASSMSPVSPTEPHAVGIGAWLLLVVLLLTFTFDSATSAVASVALCVAAWAACVLIAARWANGAASASMLRWMSSAYLVTALWPWLTRRSYGRPAARNTVLALGTLPTAILTGLAVVIVAAGETLGGPAPASFLAEIGPIASYAGPLLIVAGVLVLYAWRDTRAVYGFAGSLAACFAVSSGFVMAVYPTRIGLGPSDIIHLLELNAIVLALFAIAWSAAWWTTTDHAAPGNPPIYIKVQSVIAAVLAGTVLVPAVAMLAAIPDTNWLVGSAGDLWGWAAVLSVVAAAVARRHLHPTGLRVRTLALGLLALAALVACSMQAYGPRAGWPGFHMLLAGNILAAWLILAYGAWLAKRLAGLSVIGASATAVAQSDVIAYHNPAQSMLETALARASLTFGGERLLPSVIRWSIGIAMLAVLLALRGAWGDPSGPWWSAGTITLAACLLAMISCWANRPRLLFGAGLLLNLAASLWFFDSGWNLHGSPLLNFLCVNVAMLALPGMAWLVLELQIFRQGEAPAGWRKTPAHRAAAMGSILILGLIAAISALSRLAVSQSNLPGGAPLVLAILATFAISLACLWDRNARHVPASLYAIGLLVVAFALEFQRSQGVNLMWDACLAISVYTLLVSILWNARGKLLDIAQYFREPVQNRAWSFGWLEAVSTALAGIVIILAFWSDFAFDRTWVRLASALAAISQVAALALLARDDRKLTLRQTTLSIAALAAVVLGWAWMSPASATVLERSVVVFITLTIVTAFYVLLLPKLVDPESLWQLAAKTIAAQVAGVAALALAFTLGTEIYFQIEFGAVPMRPTAIALVLICLLASTAGAVLAAIRATHLSDRLRVGCVYGAEALLALAFAHARLTMPYLFHHFFHAYWPLAMMAIAFAGVGAGEILRRQGQWIFAQPLERTGVFLPLLPVLAFWAAPPTAVNLGQLLLTVAVFYTLMASLRRSITFAAIAALAANGALWHLLAHTPGWGFFQHPQIWLIPIALAVLVASQLNRDRLSAEQVRLARYGALIMVYASSTADVFLNGVAVAPWLPLVLAGLSVAGVLTGIIMHIRPFLYLGTMFLLLSVITMIYYASSQLHWTWIWYVAGIILGAGIIVMFAVFERRKA